MAIAAPTFIAGLAFTIGVFTASQAPAAQDQPITLVLHVDNYARVPAEQLEQSKVEVARIYKAAGIHTVWFETDGQGDLSIGGPDADRGTVHVRVLLLCEEMAARKIALDVIPEDVLGRAAGPTGRAYILTPRVAAVAERHHRNFDRLLGRVIAHEVGHLLLPPYSHSRSGIMRERLDLSSRPSQSFTRSQRKAILLTLQSRN